jgi:Zn-dependent protease
MKCEKCQSEIFLPFKCPYCGHYYCPNHRLPENHNCTHMQQARTQQQETITVTRKREPYEYSVTYIPTTRSKGKIYFSPKEAKHLTIAALLVLAIGFSPVIFFHIQLTDLILFTVILIASFFVHEIAHKAAAQRKGLWAEFRLTLIGSALTLVSIISPFFKIISPGAVTIGGFPSIKSMGKISIVGPTTNIALSAALLVARYLMPQYEIVLLLGAFFNGWMALFNMIPFGTLDGYKVFLWNKVYWASVFAVSTFLTVFSYLVLNGFVP